MAGTSGGGIAGVLVGWYVGGGHCRGSGWLVRRVGALQGFWMAGTSGGSHSLRGFWMAGASGVGHCGGSGWLVRRGGAIAGVLDGWYVGCLAGGSHVRVLSEVWAGPTRRVQVFEMWSCFIRVEVLAVELLAATSIRKILPIFTYVLSPESGPSPGPPPSTSPLFSPPPLSTSPPFPFPFPSPSPSRPLPRNVASPRSSLQVHA